jgi:hypothetical protein
MAQEFYRNQNPSERGAKMNALVDRVSGVEVRVDALEAGGVSPTSPALDPGDLTVYYENGKA